MPLNHIAGDQDERIAFIRSLRCGNLNKARGQPSCGGKESFAGLCQLQPGNTSAEEAHAQVAL